jgi:hypothetical protein
MSEPENETVGASASETAGKSPFSRRALYLIFGVGGASLIGLLVLLGLADRFASGTLSYEDDSYSRSAIGHRALCELWTQSGISVELSRAESAAKIGKTTPLALIEPHDGKQIAPMLKEAHKRDATVLLVLPRATGERSAANPGWIGTYDEMDTSDIESILAASGDPRLAALRVERFSDESVAWDVASSSLSAPALSAPQVVFDESAGSDDDDSGDDDSGTDDSGSDDSGSDDSGSDDDNSDEGDDDSSNDDDSGGDDHSDDDADTGLKPLVSVSGGVVIGSYPATADGPAILLVADPTLLENMGIGKGQNAAIAVALLTDLLKASGVVVDETIHGHKVQSSLFARLTQFPVLLISLHVLLLALLFCAWVAPRFGPPVPIAPRLEAGKRVLVENTADLLTQFGHARESCVRYVRAQLRDAARAVSLGGPAFARAAGDLGDRLGDRADTVQLAKALQRLSEVRGVPLPPGGVVGLEERALAVPEKAGRRATKQALEIALDTHRWHKELTHGSRHAPGDRARRPAAPAAGAAGRHGADRAA